MSVINSVTQLLQGANRNVPTLDKILHVDTLRVGETVSADLTQELLQDLIDLADQNLDSDELWSLAGNIVPGNSNIGSTDGPFGHSVNLIHSDVIYMALSELVGLEKIDMFRQLDMNNNKIASVGNPTNPGDAANKAYVDDFLEDLEFDGWLTEGNNLSQLGQIGSTTDFDIQFIRDAQQFAQMDTEGPADELGDPTERNTFRFFSDLVYSSEGNDFRFFGGEEDLNALSYGYDFVEMGCADEGVFALVRNEDPYLSLDPQGVSAFQNFSFWDSQIILVNDATETSVARFFHDLGEDVIKIESLENLPIVLDAGGSERIRIKQTETDYYSPNESLAVLINNNGIQLHQETSAQFNKIVDVADGTAGNDAVNVAQLDAVSAVADNAWAKDGNQLSVTGTLGSSNNIDVELVRWGSAQIELLSTGVQVNEDINFALNVVDGVPLPTLDNHAANKKFVEDSIEATFDPVTTHQTSGSTPDTVLLKQLGGDELSMGEVKVFATTAGGSTNVFRKYYHAKKVDLDAPVLISETDEFTSKEDEDTEVSLTISGDNLAIQLTGLAATDVNWTIELTEKTVEIS
jgi:hypothetical protein